MAKVTQTGVMDLRLETGSTSDDLSQKTQVRGPGSPTLSPGPLHLAACPW